MTATVDRTSAAVSQLVDAIAALAAAQVAAEVERLAPQLLTQTAEQAPPAPAPTASPDAAPAWMSVAQAAAYSGRHREGLYLALREYETSRGRKGLRGSHPKPKASWRIRRDDLDAWLAGVAPKRRKP